MIRYLLAIAQMGSGGVSTEFLEWWQWMVMLETVELWMGQGDERRQFFESQNHSTPGWVQVRSEIMGFSRRDLHGPVLYYVQI